MNPLEILVDFKATMTVCFVMSSVHPIDISNKLFALNGI